MGYFFRPRFPSVFWIENRKLWSLLSKEMDAPNNKYSFAGSCREGKQFAHWRWWGCFIHDPHYKDFINKLFIVIKDPTCDSDYDGDCIWRRRFNTDTKDGDLVGECFNKKYSDGFTLLECNEAFQQLIQLIKDSKDSDWLEDNYMYSGKEFIANLKQSLKYIMLSKWEDYEAY